MMIAPFVVLASVIAVHAQSQQVIQFQQPSDKSVWIAGQPQTIEFSFPPLIDNATFNLKLYEDGSGFLRILPDRQVGDTLSIDVEANQTSLSVQMTVPLFEVRRNSELYYVAITTNDIKSKPLNGSHMLRSPRFHALSSVSGHRRFKDQPVLQLVKPREFDNVQIGSDMDIEILTNSSIALTLYVDLCRVDKDLDWDDDDFDKVKNGSIGEVKVPQGLARVDIKWPVPLDIEGGFSYALCFRFDSYILRFIPRKKMAYRSGRINLEWPDALPAGGQQPYSANASSSKPNSQSQENSVPTNSRGEFVQKQLQQSGA